MCVSFYTLCTNCKSNDQRMHECASEYTSCKIRNMIHFLHATGCRNMEIHEELKRVYSAACIMLATIGSWVAQFDAGRTRCEVLKFVHSLSPEAHNMCLSGLVKWYFKCLDNGSNYIEKQCTINVSSLEAFRCTLVFFVILLYLLFGQPYKMIRNAFT